MPHCVLYPGSDPQEPEGAGRLCCSSIWLVCGSLCSFRGRRTCSCSHPGSVARLWSSKLSPCKETFSKGWLVPLLGLQPAFPQCQSWNSLFFWLLTSIFLFLIPSFPSVPIPLLSFNSLHHQHIFTEEDLSYGFYCQPMLSWHEKLIKKEITSSSEGIEDCSHILSFMWDQKLPEKHKS